MLLATVKSIKVCFYPEKIRNVRVVRKYCFLRLHHNHLLSWELK